MDGTDVSRYHVIHSHKIRVVVQNNDEEYRQIFTGASSIGRPHRSDAPNLTQCTSQDTSYVYQVLLVQAQK